MGRKNGAARDPVQEAEREERAARVRAMVYEGLPFRTIAEQLGISCSTAHDLWRLTLSRVAAENVEECRAKFDADFQACLPSMREKAMRGDAQAFQALCRGYALHAKVMGYAAPERHEVTGKDGGPLVVEGAHDELLARLDRLAAAARTAGGDPEPQSN